jgi:hypothetical protein
MAPLDDPYQARAPTVPPATARRITATSKYLTEILRLREVFADFFLGKRLLPKGFAISSSGYFGAFY